MDPLLLAHAAATLTMTGIIWFVQLVHYPSFALIDRGRFVAFERRHSQMTTIVVGPPMLIEIASATLLVTSPFGMSGWMPQAGAVLLGIVWLSTWLLQVPCHRRLERGFDAAVHRRLVHTNWIRTAGWSLRTALVLAMAGASGQP